MKLAIIFAYRFLARSQEYLACLKGGVFDITKVVCCRDITFYKDGKQLHKLRDFHLADEMEVEFNIQKNNRRGVLDVCSVFAGDDPDYCPVKLMARHFQSMSRFQPDSPVFKWDKDLAQQGDGVRRSNISLVLKTAAAVVGFEKQQFASHSLRRGGAQMLRQAGYSLTEIAAFGRWRSGPDGSVKVYVKEHGDIFEGGVKAEFRFGEPLSVKSRARIAKTSRQRHG